MYKAMILATATVLAATAQGNVITWGGGSGNWNVATNWSGGVLPTAGDTAVIASGTPYVNATLSPAPDVIRVDPGGAAQFTANNANNFVLNGGTLQASGTSAAVSGTVRLTGNSTIRSTVGNSNRVLTISGTISEDATPRKLTFDGKPHTAAGVTNDNIKISGTNTYSGGTDVYGPLVNVASTGALGSGPVNVYSGRLSPSVSGPYTFGTVSVYSSAWGQGALEFNAASPKNLTVNMQGGLLTSQGKSGGTVTIDSTNSVTISNTVGIGSALATGGGYPYPLNLNTTVSGSGKAVLQDWGSPTYGTSWTYFNTQKLVIGAGQSWTGNTEVRGTVDINAGGSLPGGTVTVYGVDNSRVGTGTGKGELRLLNTAAGANGGLDIATDLVLVDQTFTSGMNTLICYASLNLATNVIVDSLMINGVTMPAGNYLTSDPAMANYLISNSATVARTLTVLTPEPATLALLVLAGAWSVVRRRR